MGVNSLPKTVILQRRGCDLNPGPSVPESSTRTTRLPSHQKGDYLSYSLQLLRNAFRVPFKVALALKPLSSINTRSRSNWNSRTRYDRPAIPIYDMEAEVNIAYRIFANSYVNGRIGADTVSKLFSRSAA